MKLGFIGLGHMGLPMATNLLESGHELTVYNRNPEKVRELAGQGAHVSETVSDACLGDAVITMVADDSALEQIVFGEAGVLANLKHGALHISMSTISVSLSEKLTKVHSDAGQRYVAAPVFGRPDAAQAAKLFVVTAGAPDAVQFCLPLFQALSQRVFTVSEKPADANLIKLSGNFLLACVIESLGEAMALISKAGIDKTKYLELLTSTLFPAPVYKTYGSLIAEERFEPAGFAARLGQKDIRLTLAAAEDLRVPLPLASLLRDRFLDLSAQGGDQLDWSAIAKLSGRDSGQQA